MNKIILAGAIGFATGAAIMLGIEQVVKRKLVKETDVLLKAYSDLTDKFESDYQIWADYGTDESEDNFYKDFFDDLNGEGLNADEDN